MKKPKLLYTICTTKIAGTERQLLMLCKYLKNDFDIIVICPKASALNSKFKNLSVKIINLDFNLKNLFKLMKIIKKEKIEIVHNHLGKSALLGTLAGRLAGVKNIVTTRHFIRPAYAKRNSVRKYIHLAGYKFINILNIKLIAVSETVRKAVIRREKVGGDKVITIHNGTDLKPRKMRENKSYKIGVVSRLSSEKGIDYLIDAMPEVLKQFPKAECLIAGEGPRYNELREKMKRARLDGHIKLLGFVDDIGEFLDEIDLFVLPSIEEPFGLAIIEAQICGIPVISTDSGGPKEIIINNKTGILILPENPKALSDSIIKLFKNRKFSNVIAEAGQKRTLELFEGRKMSDRYRNLYKTLLNVPVK